MTYNNALKHIRSLGAVSSGIEHVRTLLDALNSPQRQLKSIRICGDAGKTSCARMLSSILTDSGYRIGHYCHSTSDELRECIRMGEKFIPHAEFADIAKRVFDASAATDSARALSQSDVTFAVALTYFAANDCDAVIIERRLNDDAYPLVEEPLLSVITSIFDSIPDDKLPELIARGTKETVTCIQHKEIYSLISAICAEEGCRLSLPLYADLEIKKISLFNTRFTYRGNEYSLGAFSPCQLLNAITVIEAAHALARLGINLTEKNIASGLSNARLPLMCQVLTIEPTIIVAKVETERQLETLIASLAQVNELVHNRLDVFLSPDNAPLSESLPSRLASCSIECSTPKILSELTSHDFARQIGGIISPVVKSEDNSYAALFIGSKEYVSELAEQIKKILGSFV